MANAAEIDLAGLDKQIKDVNKEIQNLSSNLSNAERIATQMSNLELVGKLKQASQGLTNMSVSVNDMVSSMAKGEMNIGSFITYINKLQSSLSSIRDLGAMPVTGLMESLNKLQYGLNAAQHIYANIESGDNDRILRRKKHYQEIADAIQKQAVMQQESAQREKENAEWAKQHSQAYKERKRLLQESMEAQVNLQRRLRTIQEGVDRGDVNAIGKYLKMNTSISRMNRALAIMREKQEQCNLATRKGQEEYVKYEQHINKIQAALNRINGQQGMFMKLFSSMKESAGQVAMSFGIMTGVFGATNFIRSLYKITAEFQLQQRALAAIIRNAKEADTLFKQMQMLAVESPMKLMDLNKYAKQLAAFRIETQELYSTLKMLGDISVGVGVDMDRLILAYGQVRAANYLRGQELRQFSEAGVNILGGLQEYYKETKNINMSINEIFDSVSKRKVLFEDVDAVLRKMTESGGTFYNMQLIQSQTLYGQLQKLGDIYQIQMNEIGKSTSGILLFFVKLVQLLATNLKLLLSVVAAFSTYKGVRKLVLDIKEGKVVSKEFKLMLEACRVQASLLSKAGWKELIANIKGATAASAGLKANLIGLGASLAVLMGTAIYSSIQKRNQRLEETADKLTEIRKRTYEVVELDKQFKSKPLYKERLVLLQQLAEKAKEFGYNLRIVENITPQNISKAWEEALKNFNDYNDRVANYEAAIANRPGVERNTKDLARITGVQALAYEEARRDFEFFTTNADKLTTAAKKELESITKIKEDFIKNERQATLEYGYTSKQFETVFAESMLRIRQLVQGTGGAIASEFEKERGGFNTYLKKFFKGGFFGQNDYKSELNDVKRKLKKAKQ